MRLVHAACVLLTVLMFFVKQRCSLPRVCSVGFYMKRRSILWSPRSWCDFLATTRSDQSLDDYARQCGDYCRPKYKRDPDVKVDNEEIGQHPYD